MIDVDLAGSIGRRYRRQDEVGTPLCVTVDFDTLDDRRGHRPRPRHDEPGRVSRSTSSVYRERPQTELGRTADDEVR